ncbi:hypothetical protein EG350_07010 [Chryseobacterium shandongense]|nr:hypothetical protein EG350_07010 [Chryseobacterium shandongense]
MDAIPFFMGKQVFETGEIVLPAGEGRASFLPREEMAEAAVNVLISKGNEGKPYNISNIYSYDYMEISVHFLIYPAKKFLIIRFR